MFPIIVYKPMLLQFFFPLSSSSMVGGMLEVKVVKPRENPIFSKNGKIVILVKIQNFSRSQMTKQTSPLELSREI